MVYSMSNTDHREKRSIVFVTGLSGAGMSSALNILQDLGFYVLDNLPLALIQSFLDYDSDDETPLAIGIDSRSKDFSLSGLTALLSTLRTNNPNNHYVLLYMDCNPAFLLRRFNENRRKHPFLKESDLQESILKEKEFLDPLKESADIFIDTSLMTTKDLRLVLKGKFHHESKPLLILVQSFSYKFGIPRESDLLFDVRFLKNPHYVDTLSHQTGQVEAVGDYIEEDPIFPSFYQNLKNLLQPLLVRYIEEGKNYLAISFGCTGGKHRSVYMAEALSKWLRDQGYIVHTKHRELEKNQK